MKKKFLIGGALLFTGLAFGQWTQQATGFGTPSRGVNSITIVDANTVWVGAYDGALSTNYITDFSKTINGGTNWAAGSINTGLTGVGLGNISAIDADTAWACIFHPTQTVAGGIWKTTDGGLSWNKQNSAAFGISSFPDFVYFWDANNGIAVGDPLNGFFEVYTTGDGGTTWTRSQDTTGLLAISPAEYGYTNDFSVVGGTLWFGTTKGRVFKTTDKGFTFTNSTVANGITDVQKISFADASTGYAFMHASGNKQYKISKSTDGGATWVPVINNTAITETSVLGGDITAVPGTNSLIAVGSDNSAIGSAFSHDNGATWSLMEDTSLAPQRLSVRFLNDATGWAGAFNVDAFTSGIYKFSGIVGLGNENETKSGVSVFPSPVSDVLTINLNGLGGEPLVITVLNLLGEKIYSEKIQIESPIYLKHISVSSLPAGVYFVEVQNSGKRFTNKFVKH